MEINDSDNKIAPWRNINVFRNNSSSEVRNGTRMFLRIHAKQNLEVGPAPDTWVGQLACIPDETESAPSRLLRRTSCTRDITKLADHKPSLVFAFRVSWFWGNACLLTIYRITQILCWKGILTKEKKDKRFLFKLQII